MSQTKLEMPELSEKNTEEVKCLCGGNTFVEAMKLRRVSRLLTGRPKDITVSIPAVLCSKCGVEYVGSKEDEPSPLIKA